MRQVDVAQYWEERFARGPALENVGFLSLGPAFNTWMYRVRRALFNKRIREALERYGIDIARAKVLDVGSGSGFYIERWKELGAKAVTGYDLTHAAVTALSRKHPDVTFRQVDIGTYDASSEDGKYDVISCMDVLYHIVDDVKYASAISNMASMLKGNGMFVITENCLHRTAAVRSDVQASRTLREIETIIAGAGLKIEQRVPVFVIMNTPIDSANVVLRGYWKALEKVVSHSNAFGYCAGAALYWPERLLAERVREGPSTEMLICRRV